MKKRYKILLVIFSCVYIHGSENNVPPLVFENKNNIQNNINVFPQNINQDCSLLTGKHLKECMACLDKQHLKTNFFKLNPRAAAYYLKNLNDEEKYEFLSHFTEDEWVSWWLSIHEKERVNLPSTKQEQLSQIYKRSAASAYYAEKCAFILTELICWILKLAGFK